MNLATVETRAQFGLDAPPVRVEVFCGSGLPQFSVVGLAETAVRESRERVRAAIAYGGRDFPPGRVTVNLAPATLRKSGSGLEVAVAVGLLVADEQLPDSVLDGVGLLGELGLDGRVRAIPGVLAMVDALARTGVEQVVVPMANTAEAALVPGVTVRAARCLAELHLCLKGELPW